MSQLPQSVDCITKFVAYLSLQKFSYSTVATYLSGLSFFLKTNSIPDFTDNFLVRKLLQGLKRDSGKEDARLPITSKLLSKLVFKLSLVTYSEFEASMFKAAFTLAFFAFLRVGEFTSGTKHEGGHTLQLRDVSFGSVQGVSGMSIHLRSSKTDQFGKGTTIFLAQSLHSSAICPVLFLENYLRHRPTSPGPLFIHFDGSPLTRFQFNKILSKVIALTDHRLEGHVSSHSFRIGAATSAAMLGFSYDQIQEWGRWRSTCFRNYIRPPVGALSNML